MVNVAVGILALAAIGIYCGVLQILDAFGVINYDDPEREHYKTTDYSKKEDKSED